MGGCCCCFSHAWGFTVQSLERYVRYVEEMARLNDPDCNYEMYRFYHHGLYLRKKGCLKFLVYGTRIEENENDLKFVSKNDIYASYYLQKAAELGHEQAKETRRQQHTYSWYS